MGGDCFRIFLYFDLCAFFYLNFILRIFFLLCWIKIVKNIFHIISVLHTHSFIYNNLISNYLKLYFLIFISTVIQDIYPYKILHARTVRTIFLNSIMFHLRSLSIKLSNILFYFSFFFCSFCLFVSVFYFKLKL